MVSQFCDDDMNNRVNEEYSDQCMALENVVKLICHLCARYGVLTVVYMSIKELGVLGLLHFGPGAQLFNGRHLLLVLLMDKYIYENPAGNDRGGGAICEDCFGFFHERFGHSLPFQR